MRETRTRGREGIELHLGNGQIVAFVVVAMALLGLAFALGLKAGQQLGAGEGAPVAASPQTPSPEDRLAALDARAQADAERQVAPPPAQPPELTFAQELTKPSDRPQAPSMVPVPVPPPPAKASEPRPASAAAPSAVKASTESDRDQGAAEPTPAKGEGGLRAAFSKAASSAPQAQGGFALQVASLPTEKAAQDEVRRLGARGLTAWVTPAEVKGATYYRVKVGPYASRAEAQAASAEVAQKCGSRPIVANAN